MRFNHRELALYASNRLGKADKEGCLWMKEYEGILRKKETYTQRWFLLTGNLLFYCRTEYSDSGVVGLIILERCRVENDSDGGNRNAFKLTFEDSEVGYSFLANSAKDQDEWTTALNSGSYEYLRMAFSELRGQLMHLTGRDPLVEDHPLGDLPIKNVSAMPASAPVFEGEPVFELSLACSSLVGSLRDGVPSALIVSSCQTPPQAYWIRYAQTEVIERNCDPRFFTTVVFYTGSVSMATRLKFEVFDVYDRMESKMCPIGQAQCQVMELVRAPDKTQRLEIMFDNAICGYLHVRAWKSESREGDVCPLSPVVAGKGRPMQLGTGKSPDSSGRSHFSFRAPMDSIVVRTFHFPTTNSDRLVKVTEVMGEGRYSFSIPMQILDLYIADESSVLSQYATITGLSEDWEIARQEVMLEHSAMVSQYRQNKSGLQAQLEAGVTFKKSTSKSEAELDFVPVNLHVQEMKVIDESTGSKEKVLYTVVTVGCPTAYSLKFRQGGLARMQVTSPFANTGSYSPSAENKSFRAKTLLGRIQSAQSNLHQEGDKLLAAAREGSMEGVQATVRAIADWVHHLNGHCNVTLVNDALRNWCNAVEDPSYLGLSLSEMNAGTLCHRVEEHVLCVEAQAEPLQENLLHTEDWLDRLRGPLSDLLASLDEVVTIIKRTLIFLLLKESYQLMADKVPIGLKSYKHRRDIVFSQAVTSLVTSFAFRVLQSVAVSSFLSQLMEVGFLAHWESLLSTHGDEIGMLEDFIVAIHDLNNLKFKLTLAETVNDVPKVTGTRYKVLVELPVQQTLFRVLPAQLRSGREISVCVVLFTQGVNEQQSLADTFGDSTLQDQINLHSLYQITSYCTRYKEHLGSANAKMSKKSQRAFQLLEQLRAQIHVRKTKNVDILTLSQELCRTLDCGRITSCKSAKDRTGMSVTLEQAHILLREMNMDPAGFQHALDAMRSQGTRIRNAEKNIGSAQYAFNVLQVFALPPVYRPPDGTYKKLQT